MKMLRLLLTLALLTGSVRPALAEEVLPTSGFRVAVDTAAVTELRCGRRPFDMEYTRTMGRSYRYMARSTFHSDPDPRSLIVGIFAMLFMAPMTVLAVPADLFVAPFRRQCSFRLEAGGTLVGWAGQPAGSLDLAVDGRNILSPGTEGVAAPSYFLSRSTATSGEDGRFALAMDGRVGRSSLFELGWTVRSLPSGRMMLQKSGGTFVLSEPEPEFGSSIDTIEPLVITPKK